MQRGKNNAAKSSTMHTWYAKGVPCAKVQHFEQLLN